MNVIYYSASILLFMIVGIVYLTLTNKKNGSWATFTACPHCGKKMMKNFDNRYSYGQICPSCKCGHEEFGNSF